jgi:hypothetical protein
MMFKGVARSLLRRWKQLIAGLTAALVLLPVPAMAAITFNGTWMPVISTVGGPTPPTPTWSDSTNNPGQVDNLTVNMGTYQGSTQMATSKIELTRSFSLSTDNQTLEFAQQFTSQFTKAGFDVEVHVKNSSGQNVFNPIVSSHNLSGTTTWQETDATFANIFKKGNYSLDVNVIYNTNNKLGGWKTISPHRFTFKGF